MLKLKILLTDLIGIHHPQPKIDFYKEIWRSDFNRINLVNQRPNAWTPNIPKVNQKIFADLPNDLFLSFFYSQTTSMEPVGDFKFN